MVKSKTIRYTEEDAKNILLTEGLILKSNNFVNSSTKLSVKCDKGHTTELALKDFLNKGVRCTKCSGRYTYSYDEIMDMLSEDNYTLITKREEYKNNTQILHMVCPSGHDRFIDFSAYRKSGKSCGKCKNSVRKEIDEVEDMVSELGFTLRSGEYENNRSTLVLECTKGHSFTKSLMALQTTPSCPMCYGSRGEQLISSYIHNLLPDVIVRREYKVCIEDSYHFFDFHINVGNKLFIEFDGKQHYQMINSFGGEDTFEETKRRDRLKDMYVKNMDNSFLLRIPYHLNDKDIFTSVKSFLSAHTTVKDIGYEEVITNLTSYTKEDESIAKFYLNNTRDKTQSEFNIGKTKIEKCFKLVYGVTKKAYLGK